MNSYEKRGTFQNDGWAKQLVKFDDMVFAGKSGKKTVTPTDVDVLIQLEYENSIIMAELKYKGEMSEGQRLAFESVCNATTKGGTDAVLFLAEHHTPDPDPIMAKDAIVTRYFWRGKWKPEDTTTTLPAITLLEIINRYIEYRRREIKEGT